MSSISIIKYNDSYKKDLIEFLGQHWKNLKNTKSIKELFEWKYEKNPYIENSIIYLAVEEKKIIGHLGYFVQKFKYKNRVYTFATGADAYVDPEYRRRGIFFDIVFLSTQDIIKREDIDLVVDFSPNEKSILCVKKVGYTAVGKRKKLYFFSVLHLLKSYAKIHYQIFFPIIFYNGNLKIEITNELRSQEISKFLKLIIKENKITNIRDINFYNWRYSHPLTKYIIAYGKMNNKLIGYIILQKYGKKSYSILEYGYTKQIFFKKLVKGVIRKLSIPFLWTNTLSRPESEVLLFSSLGFKNSKQLAKGLINYLRIIQDDNLPGLLISPNSIKLKDERFLLDKIDITDIKNWSIYESDIIWF